MSRLGGGIGTRGPGAKKLEIDRRLINDRIAQLNREFKKKWSNTAQIARAKKRAQCSSGCGNCRIYKCRKIHPPESSDGRRGF